MIKVTLFARLKEDLGQAAIELDLPLPIRAAELRAALIQSYPAQQQRLSASYALMAVNQELIHDPDHLIQSGDEIALLPPMTGG